MRRAVIFMLLLSLVFPLSAAIGMEAAEIVGKANQITYYQGEDGRSRVNMVITDSMGRTREREMTILRLNEGEGGAQKYYVYFHKPADVDGMAYLVWKNTQADDDRWLYLPALDLVRRVAASDKRSSFVGTQFAYEDISGRSISEDDHELVSEEDGLYVVKSVPKDPSSVEFSHFISRIDKDTFVPKGAEYYDKNGELYKTIEVLELKDIQGYPTVVRMKAEDLNAKSNTVSTFESTEYDIGLNDKTFTERFLRKPPRKYIK